MILYLDLLLIQFNIHYIVNYVLFWYVLPATYISSVMHDKSWWYNMISWSIILTFILLWLYFLCVIKSAVADNESYTYSQIQQKTCNLVKNLKNNEALHFNGQKHWIPLVVKLVYYFTSKRHKINTIRYQKFPMSFNLY